MEWMYFLGRFHVLALHVPIGILIAVIGLEILARRSRFRHLESAAPYLWGVAALSALLTATLGYMHFAEGGFDGPAAFRHRFFGTGVAVVTTLIWIARMRFAAVYRHVQLASGALVLALVTITGHYGGTLTHGDTYLVEHAPNAVRTLAGLPPRREKITDVAMANPFEDIVQPIFAARCAGCHNENKQRGGLSLASFASLMKGGTVGPVVVAGDAARSDLVRRISLPPDDKDVMPAEGKAPLSADQVRIIRWWVESGARADKTLADAKLTPEMKSLLSAALGVGPRLRDPSRPAIEGFRSGAGVPGERGSAPAVADQKTVDRLIQAGFLVRQLSQSDPRLVVSAVGLRELQVAQWSALNEASGQIAQLSLARLGLRDEQIAPLAHFKALVRLNLAENALSDAGVRWLGSLQSLESLNLYGNSAITDASLDVLGKLASLHQLYAWDTRITAGGAKKVEVAGRAFVVNLGTEVEVPRSHSVGGS